MNTILAPTLILPREEWPDADFDLPEGVPLHAHTDKDDEADWDLEMDLGKTGGAKAKAVMDGLAARSEMAASFASSSTSGSSMINIRPPIHVSDTEDDDEGVSTIKASNIPTITKRSAVKPTIEPLEEDFEDAFSLPTDLTQLSLAPLSLNHKGSKNSLEWGEKDNSSSSQSSDTYSTLGFAEASSSSNSTSSASLPDTETEEDEDELEGLVLPTALFESGHSARQLKKILDTKKHAHPSSISTKPSKPDPEDDFEMGLVINDDVELSPSRLLFNAQHTARHFNRSSSAPLHRPSSLRPPSRSSLVRSKSPSIPPTSSAKQLQKIRLSPSPPLRPPSRSQTFQPLVTPASSASGSSNLLAPKPGSLRGQKSHSGLKPPSPPSSKKLSRKASLSSLMETSYTHAQASSSKLPPPPPPPLPPSEARVARYEVATAASRAKSHKNSTSRMHDFKVPPTRPSTPSSNPAALRLTMPTQSRLKSRPALSQVFGSSNPATPINPESAPPRAVSPLPVRPPSSSSLRAPTISRSVTQPVPTAVGPKLLRRPKKQKTYGDGTELDGFDDLPTDWDKEVRYRVQPKGYGNRIPGATYASKVASEKDRSGDKGTIRRKGKREGSTSNELVPPHTPLTNTLRRTTTKIDFRTSPGVETSPKRKKRDVSSPLGGKRKPTLIRNLGGANAPKVVGEMKWNPQTLRWEGNDQVLRDFDAAVGSSTRPALITHLTGSVMGSPHGSFAAGARIVGNMVFDPQKMCWISTLAPEHDEPDVFANLADDEEDWDGKGATIRGAVPRVSDASSVGTAMSSNGDSHGREGSTSPAPSLHSRTISESGSDRGSRASMVVGDIDDAFIASCRQAEDRHKVEMKGWKSSSSRREVPSLSVDRSWLYEIRALATRKY
ncbi:hypothetical protein CPB83DRAFT_379411 [Crepidotus variabilis]|uniref:Protein byr4 n=1 Tax=Crepidotus variabilis TaxID=179855 RepID=A0A9P6JPM2_9AGAR|nr:hypothetical protein CPB83DRAFT_379411 [Crepidotus variabilis]